MQTYDFTDQCTRNSMVNMHTSCILNHNLGLKEVLIFVRTYKE